MRDYELVVLFHPDLEIDIDAPIKKIEQVVASNDGKVIKRDNWGKKRLAYNIGAHQFAVYVYFGLQLESSKVDAINHALQISEEVIRYLLVKQEEPRVMPESKKPKKTEEANSGEDKVKEAVNG